MKKKIENVCCIGAGYVGGPSMAVFADYCSDIQFNVVDINEDRIKAWNSDDLSKLPIYEPGLDTIIFRCRGRNLHFSTKVEEKIASADMIFLSVNTPTKQKGIGAGKASDLRWIEASSRQVATFAKGHTIVIEKSTLPVRTAGVIKSILSASQVEGKESKTFSVLSNPEFLAEGTAINDLQKPDRVLIGGDDNEAIDSLTNLYSKWVSNDKIIRTSLWSSELSKLTANAFLAQRISSMNSISALCEATEADIEEVAKAIGSDSRIGDKFLKAGPGFGGSCFKKDILNLVYLCDHYGLHEVAEYWQQVVEINSWQQSRISESIVKRLYGTVTDKQIAIFGFAFKANTNDTRESPAISICNDLMIEGANLAIYDPQVNKLQIASDLNVAECESDTNQNQEKIWKYCNSALDAARNAHAIVILTEWEEFSNLDWEQLFRLMCKPSWVFDTRRCIDENKAKDAGFNLWELGHN